MNRARAADAALLAGFFMSGASALMYQVAWQRALFALIGVDIDSITIIVSVFMFGIGAGGMLGGWVADRWPARRLAAFGAIEFAIGLFGLASLGLLHALLAALSTAGLAATGGTVAACFAFMAFPTVLMGITLPLLTIAFDERRGNIGVSAGTLYFVNTLGAALGAALVPFALLPRWELPEVVRIAAGGNFAVIVFVAVAIAATRRAP